MTRSTRRRSLAVAVAALAVALPASAQATSTPAQIATSVSNGTAYIKTLQQTNGDFTTAPGSPPLDWALSALAAAGVAPADVKKTGGTNDGRGAYLTLLSSPSWPGGTPPVTDYERGALNAYAAGIDPARVAIGQNVLANIYSSWQTASPGYWGSTSLFNGTVFGLLALAGSKTQGGVQRVPQAILDKSIAVVRNNEHNDGGWSYTKADGSPTVKAQTSDIDMTGAALASLCVSGVPNTDTAVVAGKNFLKGKLIAASGAFNAMFGANTDSNAWAVDGLKACGFDAQGADFTSPSPDLKTPIDFLIAQQFTTGGPPNQGGWRYLPASTAADAYASIDALRATGGGGFTATPPAPVNGQPQWDAVTAFSTTAGVTSSLAVSVDDGSGTLKVCSVTVAPAATTTTLGAVLDRAIAGNSSPASCVTAILPTTGAGTITSLNGVANGGGKTWKVSVDGAAAAGATRGKVIGVGDTIALKYGT